MKKILMSAAALSLVAGAAFAAPPVVGPLGGDGVSNIYIDGSASLFCELGQASAGTGTENASTDFTVSGFNTANGGQNNGYSGATSDGVVKFNLQDPANDTVDAASQVVAYTGSICNAVYNVRAVTTHGGLDYTGTNTGGDPAFENNILYDVKVDFDGNHGSAKSSDLTGAGEDLITDAAPSVGEFDLKLSVAASPRYMREGDYQDNVLITMAPGI